ncbi:ferredoxin family protein [Selenomonas sp. oral taxon 138 str. F0429]|nr:ferredoxin family protein [Selenomonas sp. oral taxon 138 str. F0429]
MKRLLLRLGAAGNFHLESAMKLSIDTDACVSCGMCAERLPDVFRIDRVARAAVIVRQPRPAEQDDAIEAAEDCPAGAIVLRKH